MTTKPQTPVEKSTATKQPKKRSFKSGLLTGAMILSLLQPTMSKTNAQLKAELTQALEQPTNSEMKITLSDAEAGGKKPKIVEAVKVAPLDTYDELKTFVLPPKDTIYFNELRAFQEKKNSLEQLKCKAIMYTMLQDTILKKLDPRQREIFALGRFETLIDMPGNNFKFSMKSEAIEGKVYIDKGRRYDAFKVFLDRTDIPAAFAELDERTQRYPLVAEQRDPEGTATGETLRFKQLLYLYKKGQK